MIEIINKAIDRKIKSGNPTTVVSGIVESLDPLKIKVNDRLTIGLGFIEPKSLGISDISPNPALPFIIGDKINMIKYNKGQRFYVLGAAGSGGGIPKGVITSPNQSSKYTETVTKEEFDLLVNNNNLIKDTIYNIMDDAIVQATGDNVYVQLAGDGYSPKIEIEEQSATVYKLKIINEEGSYVTPNLQGSGGITADQVKEIILEEDKKKYYIGKIIMETSNINPSTYLGFGEWVLWGAGRVPVGVNAADTNYNIPDKEGGVSSHTHTSAAHTHTAPSHRHAGPSHTHSGPNHSHSSASHSHSYGSLYAAMYVAGTSGLRYRTKTGISFTTNERKADGGAGYNLTATYSEGVQVYGSTSATTPGSTGAGGTGSTGAGGSGYTTYGGNTATSSTTPGNTGSSSNIQPYITCYMWKRIA